MQKEEMLPFSSQKLSTHENSFQFKMDINCGKKNEVDEKYECFKVGVRGFQQFFKFYLELNSQRTFFFQPL